MPARSKAQQRLFGMVHAYNKGTLSAGGDLRKRIAAIASRMSDEDAEHFATTPHKGLPEKRAQYLRPDEAQKLYAQMMSGYSIMPSTRSRKRRTFMGDVLRGALAGGAVGGLGAGLITTVGGYGVKGVVDSNDVLGSALRLGKGGVIGGLCGLIPGAAIGSVLGAGLGLYRKMTGEDDDI